eukprot:CAMPEP_0116007590 /NCGR_PEP_ID=MMETSP0321-20121206/2384_1 /TAXON_ID=163516 /ORGANISM="Leptocylindrus danicus var. danicus, Strain B650" /LENGTH=35 /DNA_ID= /DNA_START= /DNA_END= /DNA_ORIENTATION=
MTLASGHRLIAPYASRICSSGTTSSSRNNTQSAQE